MRYTNQKAFEKHLAASAPHHLCRLYLILSQDDFERKIALDAALSFTAGHSSLLPVRFQGPAESRAILDALSTTPLFGGESVVVVEEANQKLIDALAAAFNKEAPFGFLLLGSKSKIASPFVDSHGVILDLLEEKPWEKEKRWTELLYEKAKSAGKRLLPDAAAYLIEHLEQNTALFSHEMDKLLCYTAAKPLIERSDAEAVCASSRTYTQWQLAEELVWEKTQEREFDSALFHGLLANVRSQLSIGAKMHALHLGGVPYQEWGGYFPKIWPRALEKKAHAASRLGQAYFKQGLDLLFKIEMLSRGSAVSQEALYDLLRLRLSHAKR